jgi:hypothetical protein
MQGAEANTLMRLHDPRCFCLKIFVTQHTCREVQQIPL